jgi:hypothetical protein
MASEERSRLAGSIQLDYSKLRSKGVTLAKFEPPEAHFPNSSRSRVIVLAEELGPLNILVWVSAANPHLFSHVWQ